MLAVFVGAAALLWRLADDDARVNPNGGAIALGHPLGASGARITSNLVYTMKALGKSISVGGACIGGGQGIALVLENL